MKEGDTMRQDNDLMKNLKPYIEQLLNNIIIMEELESMMHALQTVDGNNAHHFIGRYEIIERATNPYAKGSKKDWSEAMALELKKVIQESSNRIESYIDQIDHQIPRDDLRKQLLKLTNTYEAVAQQSDEVKTQVTKKRGVTNQNVKFHQSTNFKPKPKPKTRAEKEAEKNTEIGNFWMETLRKNDLENEPMGAFNNLLIDDVQGSQHATVEHTMMNEVPQSQEPEQLEVITEMDDVLRMAQPEDQGVPQFVEAEQSEVIIDMDDILRMAQQENQGEPQLAEPEQMVAEEEQEQMMAEEIKENHGGGGKEGEGMRNREIEDNLKYLKKLIEGRKGIAKFEVGEEVLDEGNIRKTLQEWMERQKVEGDEGREISAIGMLKSSHLLSVVTVKNSEGAKHAILLHAEKTIGENVILKFIDSLREDSAFKEAVEKLSGKLTKGALVKHHINNGEQDKDASTCADMSLIKMLKIYEGIAKKEDEYQQKVLEMQYQRLSMSEKAKILKKFKEQKEKEYNEKLLEKFMPGQGIAKVEFLDEKQVAQLAWAEQTGEALPQVAGSDTLHIISHDANLSENSKSPYIIDLSTPLESCQGINSLQPGMHLDIGSHVPHTW